MDAKRKIKTRVLGQATIEMALALPFLIWLIFYTINAYHAIHTSHIGQRYAAMNLYTRMSNRAKFVMDDQAMELHNQNFMAVQYMDPAGNPPERKIISGPTELINIFGICREPVCR